jgi:hypothetical protein
MTESLSVAPQMLRPWRWYDSTLGLEAEVVDLTGESSSHQP